jgi:methionine aminopeptidase
MALLRLHPALELADRVADAVEHDEELGEQGLEAGAIAVVAVDRLDERGLVLLEHARQCLQVGHALQVAGVRVGQVGRALARQALLEFRGYQELRGRIGEVHVVACCLFCCP